MDTASVPHETAAAVVIRSERPMDERPTGLDRRDVLKRIGAAGAVAWTAPVLLASPAGAATGSAPFNPNPECAPATCGNFVACSTSPDCVCTSTFAGGGF